jgi:hypothetical protein
MSEYQYYEFQAVDRPLDQAAQRALRSISSRARITPTSFVNHYEWGDFKGDPRKFMERWFDLHLYFANWGARRLMIGLPKRFLDRAELSPFLREIEWVKVWTSGERLIVDIFRQEEEDDYGYYEEDESEQLAAFAPLRGDLLIGDLRLFYLLWLIAVQEELVPADEAEPLPGIGPLTPALEAFATFFGVDDDLMQAAAESGDQDKAASREELRKRIAAISEGERTELLLRVSDGDAHVAAELSGKIRRAGSPPAEHPRRTVGAMRERAAEIAAARERAEAARRAAEQRREAAAAEKARRDRLGALKRRGVGVWTEVEAEIERRNALGYDRAAALLVDLRALAAEEGTTSEFSRRFAALRTRHATKRAFMLRLIKLGLDSDAQASGDSDAAGG